ncbi:MAG: hypothetical protein FWG10_10820 [Eubacteriaceae bacterium]|nr:hypothetical protein [Eubacteriaceae bacterium]
MKRERIMLLLTLLLLIMLPVPARADTGPKPSIEIVCANLKGSEVYLDLLIDDDLPSMGFMFGRMDSSFDPEGYYDKTMLDLLRGYNKDGWRPALATGTSNPLWAELRCKVMADGSAISKFNYFGVPNSFKVIIVSQDGSVAVSNRIDRKAFDSVVEVDFANKHLDDDGYWELTAIEKTPLKQTFKQFLSTLAATYLIEGVVLLLFGFGFKENWKPFVFVNLATQVALYIVILFVAGNSGSIPAMFVYLLFEIVILFVEMAAYSRLLDSNKSKGIKRLYAICANLASFFAGWMIMGMSAI